PPIIEWKRRVLTLLFEQPHHGYFDFLRSGYGLAKGKVDTAVGLLLGVFGVHGRSIVANPSDAPGATFTRYTGARREQRLRVSRRRQRHTEFAEAGGAQSEHPG